MTELEKYQAFHMLPEREQDLAFELVKRLVLAWDPDFTKATAEEAARMKAAEDSGFVADEDIDWENLSQYAGELAHD